MNSNGPGLLGASSDWIRRSRQRAVQWGRWLWIAVTVIVLLAMAGLALSTLLPRFSAGPDAAAKAGAARELAGESLVVRDLGPGDAGKHWYDVTFQAELRNGSSDEFIVPWSLDELCLGQFQPPKGETPAFINPPPKPIADAPTGSITWKLAQSQASYLWTEEGLDLGDDNIDENDVISYLKEAHLSTENANSGLIGRFLPGTARSHSAHYQFQARPDAYVSVMISYGIETRAPMLGDSPDYLWDTQHNRYELVRLSDAGATTCRWGIKVEAGRVSDACTGQPQPGVASPRPAPKGAR